MTAVAPRTAASGLRSSCDSIARNCSRRRAASAVESSSALIFCWPSSALRCAVDERRDVAADRRHADGRPFASSDQRERLADVDARAVLADVDDVRLLDLLAGAQLRDHAIESRPRARAPRACACSCRPLRRRDSRTAARRRGSSATIVPSRDFADDRVVARLDDRRQLREPRARLRERRDVGQRQHDAVDRRRLADLAVVRCASRGRAGCAGGTACRRDRGPRPRSSCRSCGRARCRPSASGASMLCEKSIDLAADVVGLECGTPTRCAPCSGGCAARDRGTPCRRRCPRAGAACRR